MVGILKSKKFLIGILVLLLVITTSIYILYYRSDSLSTSEVLNSDAVKSDLAKGECSDETTAQLKSASSSNDANERAKLYENQALCFVYADDLTSGLEAYKLAKDAYIEAGLNDEAEKLTGSIEGLEAITQPAPENPTTDAEFIGGT